MMQRSGDATGGASIDVPGGRPLRNQGQVRKRLVVGLFCIGVISICLNIGLLSRRGAVPPPETSPSFLASAGPVDRRRILGVLGNASAADEGVQGVHSISLAEMSLSPLGGQKELQWPLFWILTYPGGELTRCVEIIESWGRLVPVDSLIFIGAAENHTSTSGHSFVALNAPPEKKAIKEFLAWQFVVDVYPDREWFVKGDDDTFYVVGNLNRYLEEFDPHLAYFLGCKFHLGGAGGIQYVSGGAGYALSNTAAKRMASVVWRCLRFYGTLSEGDLAIAECLQTVGVVPEDTRDERGRQRFHAFPFDYHSNWYKYGYHLARFWYHDWVWGPVIEGSVCCGANTTVSFHYMAGQMRAFQFPDLSDRGFSQLRQGVPRGAPMLGTIMPSVDPG